MAKNISSEESPEYDLVNRILNLEKAFKELRSNQINLLYIPHLTADPASPANNQIWINDTSNTLKIRVNGVTKTVTLT
jgi:hypothetical protein